MNYFYVKQDLPDEARPPLYCPGSGQVTLETDTKKVSQWILLMN